MSTETPDDGAAWREWCRRNPTGSSAIATFMAGRASLAACLDALHAENQRLREQLTIAQRLAESGIRAMSPATPSESEADDGRR